MYGVNWSNEDIDYAGEAAKQNVEILGGRCDELKRENSELRDALESIFDDMCINCTKSKECNNLRTRCSQWVAAQSALKGAK